MSVWGGMVTDTTWTRDNGEPADEKTARGHLYDQAIHVYAPALGGRRVAWWFFVAGWRAHAHYTKDRPE